MDSVLDTEVTLSSGDKSCTFKLRDFSQAKLIRGGDILCLESIKEISSTELSFNGRARFISSPTVIDAVLFASKWVDDINNIVDLFKDVKECNFYFCDPGRDLDISDKDSLKMGIVNAIWFSQRISSHKYCSYISVGNYDDGIIVGTLGRDGGVVIRSNNGINKDVFVSRIKEATSFVYDEASGCYRISKGLVLFAIFLSLFEDVEIEHEHKLLSNQNRHKSARNVPQ